MNKKYKSDLDEIIENACEQFPELKDEIDADSELSPEEFWEIYKGVYELRILDEKYQQELERSYKDNAETDERMSEELVGVSYEADQIMESKKNIFDEAKEMFGEMRYFTEEESKAYEEALDKLFKPTERNIFDE